MSKSKKSPLPVPNFSGITHGKPHAGDFGGSVNERKCEVAHQCEPTEAMPTRMQYNWAAYPGGLPVEKGYDK